jgi:hypothetical protein
MTHATWPDGADMLARAGRHWGWMMAFGIISLLAGVAVLVWPGRTLIVVAVRARPDGDHPGDQGPVGPAPDRVQGTAPGLRRRLCR